MTNPFRNASAVFLLVQLASAFAPGAANASEPVCGDVNDSGSVTTSDALAVLKNAVGQALELTCPPLASPLKTGQTTCYNVAGAVIECPGSREDGDLQMGVTPSFQDNGDGTVTDNATGLMWEKLSNDGSVHDADAFYSWANAFEKVQTLNSQNFAGHNDWYLPNQFELYTLVNLGPGTPSISSVFHTECPNACTVLTCSCIGSVEPIYWSSTTYLNGSNGSGAWAVHFNGGFTVAVDKTFSLFARAVRKAS